MKHPITFHGNFIASLRANQRLAPRVAGAELIDNALDAGATRIEVEMNAAENRIVFSDNGRGCADMSRFAEFGSPMSAEQRDVERIGRYGVGGKQAAARLCDTERVVSVRRGTRREILIPWTAMGSSTAPMEWEELPTTRTTAPDGTSITLSGMRTETALRPIGIRACADYWRHVYAPSLRGKREIIVNGESLSPREWPALAKQRALQGAMDGKRYRGSVGVLSDESGWKPGWYVACAGRLLSDEGLLDGLDDWPGAPIWGYFELLERAGEPAWTLDTNKIDFAERAEFFAKIVSEIRELLDEAATRSREVVSGLTERELSDAIAAIMGGESHQRIREKRRPKENESGTVVPIETGRKRERAEKTDPQKPGSVVEGDHPGHRWLLEFGHFGADNEICRPTVRDRSIWVKLNLDNAFIAANANSHATLLAIAVPSIWDAATQSQRSKLWALAFGGDDYEMNYDSREAGRRWNAAALARYEAYRVTSTTSKRKKA